MPKKKDFGYVAQADPKRRLAKRLETYEGKMRRQREAARKAREGADAAARARGKSNAGRRQKQAPTRFRPGTVALRAIRHYQRRTDLLVPRAAMWR